jgi:enamine deaminase RidA (YjgF/YER057c/UK114 family)
MNIKRIGAGNRMSKAVVHGGRAYLAGFVAEAAAGKSVKEQTADILTQIDQTLKEAGSDKTKLLKANIWLTDMSRFAEMNEAWDAWVTPGQTPARATVESKLAAAGLDVEIMVEAAVDRGEGRGEGRGGGRGAARAARKAGGGAPNTAERAAKKAARQAGKKPGEKKAAGKQPGARRAAKIAARKAAKK